MITYEQLKKLGFKSVLRPRNAFSGHISRYYRRQVEINPITGEAKTIKDFKKLIEEINGIESLRAKP